MAETSTLTLVCDLQGNVTRVVDQSCLPLLSIPPGIGFTRLVERGSLNKALTFISEVLRGGMVTDWELNFNEGGVTNTLRFWGGKTADGMLLVGIRSGRIEPGSFREMLSNPSLISDQLKPVIMEAPDERSIFDEMSRLNNELMGMQRTVTKQNAELARLNREKNQFLGMAAHDLRNPLYVIQTASELLIDDETLAKNEEQKSLLTTIQSTSQFMAHLVDDLLDVARIEAGELKLEYALVDLHDLVLKNAQLQRPIAARKNIILVYDLSPLPRVMLDAAKFNQVLNNLISNAIKFSHPESSIEIGLKPDGNHFILSVKDHGLGMNEDQLNNLFKPFQRGVKGTGGEKSTGLGLTIVKKVVEGHGGRLDVESTPGSGSTFLVSIPIEIVEESK